ncbi:MAG: sigma-E factor regulatory protein RseB domain-containing protein [Armatimonadota bacterium]|nr:sigma-E factor regulatory protein RseB domain-containing protein [Armatimonadota bacterium]MDR7402443.1 sigma-E factor regulatory protein RseB domain-containing protein [Armatimonadota bacterium]MDR7403766.1 sigma-E factor regulatory protein RseB domain-containing protein [Armatimonadota bacterium]MDR7437905.1 sigma-E factor regulatory protein RseB domain-containing protein [Armatimonadota bacterium]MDR7472130.1 sigma-E factor regulatory protein RseB domain-containing protein [Armatimonadota
MRKIAGAMAATLAGAVLAAASAASPLPSADRVLEAMLAAPGVIDYEGTKVMTAVRGPRAETVTVLEAYKRLGRLRLEFLSPDGLAGRLVVDDGAVAWQYEPAHHLVIQNPSFARPAFSPSVADIRRASLVAVLGREEVIGRPAIVVALEPREGGASRRYWVDEATGVVLRTEERDVAGQVVFTSFFTRIGFGLNVPTALFRFTPPAGARILPLYVSGDPVASPDALARQAGLSRAVPAALPWGYRFRAGSVARRGALTLASAVYSDGARALTVFLAPAARWPVPQVGAPHPVAGRMGRIVDVGYFRVLLWQAGATTAAVAGSLPADALAVVAEALAP